MSFGKRTGHYLTLDIVHKIKFNSISLAIRIELSEVEIFKLEVLFTVQRLVVKMSRR